MFITIEGTDGAGKTTLINLLKSSFSDTSDVLFTREPGGTELGEKIRQLLFELDETKVYALTESYLFAAARAQHVAEVIIPALQQGVLVISDRFLDSAIAYQGGGRKIGEHVVDELNYYAVSNIEPDLTIFLDISPKEGLNRIHSHRSNEFNRMDDEDVEFYIATKQAYEQRIKDNPERFVIIDATKSKEEIFNQAFMAIKRVI